MGPLEAKDVALADDGNTDGGINSWLVSNGSDIMDATWGYQNFRKPPLIHVDIYIAIKSHLSGGIA